jgi:quercetin dioxygenase-like cupin family protein
MLAHGDGFFLALVEADAGYRGAPHEHEHTEFLYVLDGRVRTQGEPMGPGDGYVASAGSVHEDFEAEVPSRYLSIFRL